MFTNITRHEFELWLISKGINFDQYFGKTEWVYVIPFTWKGKPTNKRIKLRSGIGRHDESHGRGDDSFRAWVEYYNEKRRKWLPIPNAKGGRKYVTRQENWRTHLYEWLRELWRIAQTDERKYKSHRKVAQGQRIPADYGRPTLPA